MEYLPNEVKLRVYRGRVPGRYELSFENLTTKTGVDSSYYNVPEISMMNHDHGYYRVKNETDGDEIEFYHGIKYDITISQKTENRGGESYIVFTISTPVKIVRDMLYLKVEGVDISFYFPEMPICQNEKFVIRNPNAQISLGVVDGEKLGIRIKKVEA